MLGMYEVMVVFSLGRYPLFLVMPEVAITLFVISRRRDVSGIFSTLMVHFLSLLVPCVTMSPPESTRKFSHPSIRIRSAILSRMYPLAIPEKSIGVSNRTISPQTLEIAFEGHCAGKVSRVWVGWATCWKSPNDSQCVRELRGLSDQRVHRFPCETKGHGERERACPARRFGNCRGGG